MRRAMATRQPPRGGDHRVGTGAGARAVPPCRGAILDPHRMLGQGRCAVGPSRGSTQPSPYDCKAVLSAIEALDVWACRGP
jgi:hypothetical protein